MKCFLRAHVLLTAAGFAIWPAASAQSKIVVILPSDPTEAACFAQDVGNAKGRIRMADPVFAGMLDQLEGSPVRHTIVLTDSITTSRGNDDGHQEIEFNPVFNWRFDDDVCIDAAAGLLHELLHALENEAGVLQDNRKIATDNTNYIPLSELDATEGENLYRRLTGLCPRTTYGGMPLPPRDRVALCADPAAQSCSNQSACPKYCCWIYGLISGGYACIKDNLTDAECKAYNQPGKVNAGSYSTPCNFPGTSYCP